MNLQAFENDIMLNNNWEKLLKYSFLKRENNSKLNKKNSNDIYYQLNSFRVEMVNTQIHNNNIKCAESLCLPSTMLRQLSTDHIS